ncbi:GtrA family protein [Clostridium sp. DJ247]|uniref:GtrA family protein n=1 Tax=Clostridium sp. DJ247 TaxID=2726188 RepID=UPI001629C4AE|nr:GtrA family protein [Clostridium sp. DJ247]MBC2579452.1 GtrA family protein [Clostridium sp. DJ247]
MKLVANVTRYLFYGELKHFSRFSMVGVANTLIDFVTFSMFHSLFGINYMVSQGLGYSFGVVNSFIFNRKWTFNQRHSNKKLTQELLQFIVVNLISLIITIIAMNILVKHFYFNVYMSKVIVTVIAQITNFLFYKLWVFN